MKNTLNGSVKEVRKILKEIYTAIVLGIVYTLLRSVEDQLEQNGKLTRSGDVIEVRL